MVSAPTIANWVRNAVDHVPVHDLHTHLFPPAFRKLMLWDIDDLLTYHYLIAETLRLSDVPYDTFWSLDKCSQAELIWRTLFLENAPLSEACRGVLTVLNRLGIDASARDLDAIRRHFAGAEQNLEQFVDKVFQIANC